MGCTETPSTSGGTQYVNNAEGIVNGHVTQAHLSEKFNAVDSMVTVLPIATGDSV